MKDTDCDVNVYLSRISRRQSDVSFQHLEINNMERNWISLGKINAQN